METQLKLRDQEIGEYITPSNISEQELSENKRQLNEIQKNISKFDKAATDIIKGKIINYYYPRIDLSFLQKSNYIKTALKYNKAIRGMGGCYWDSKLADLFLDVPVFSVYRYFRTPIFKIEIAHGKYNISSSHFHLSPIIVKHIAIGMGGDTKSNLIKIKSFTDPNDSINRVTITSTLQTLVPEKTKQKVKKSLEYFEHDNIYTIAETKPEEWEFSQPKPSIQADPIVVGIIGEQAFLIDHFNSTFLEKLIGDNFTNQN